jgi:hypothetical protein
LLSSPAYEIDGEFGGYVPGLRDKLFFFGAFDPTLKRSVDYAFPGTAFTAISPVTYSTTSLNWAGKITYTPYAQTLIEASSYSDPSRRNTEPYTLSATNPLLVSSSYQYGTRNSIFRLNQVITPWLTASGSASYSTEHFQESPVASSYSIDDQTATPFTPYGFGGYNKTKDSNWQVQGELQAVWHLFGKHTSSVGYLLNHVDFNNSSLRTGNNFPIPANNAAGTALTSLFTNIPGNAIGASTNAEFLLLRADGIANPKGPAGPNVNVGCTYCAYYNGNQVYLEEIRGTYVGTVVSAISRYKTAYGNEVWSPEKHVTVNAGVRWEEQTYGGAVLVYHWRDNWSPRLGITVDPFGDRKSKVFASYSRYQNPLPLDAAIRQLGDEQDDTDFYYAPLKDANGNAILDANGSVQPNTASALNGTPLCTAATCTTLGNFGGPNFASSTGEGILPGTKMEYTNEYVLGVQREVKPGMVASARYMDRAFGRIVEDIGSQSPEGAFVDANYAGGIANPSASSDYFVNETEVTYTPAQFTAANGGRQPGQVTKANYVAPVAGCTYANDTSVAFGKFFPNAGTGGTYNGGCITNATTTAGALGADGKPDGFANPRRHYQALELELNRALRNHWQARINYRYAKLWGNYEGFFRNDNGQSDPGISSLFDFTQGALGLLGDQFKRGYLNTDHRSVGNMLVAYTIDKDTRWIGRFGNGITVGTWVHALTGAPLSAYSSHPVYDNAGEVPVGGRGTKGTLPTQIQLDMSVEDAVKVGEKYTIRGGFSAFNVTDSQPKTGQNQNLDTSFGSPANLDYGKPTAFQAAFSARFKLGFEF